MSDFNGKTILACVDGTDSRSWRKYDGSNSHVYKFYQSCYADYKKQWHGPNVAGTDCLDIKNQVYNWIHECLDSINDNFARREFRVDLNFQLDTLKFMPLGLAGQLIGQNHRENKKKQEKYILWRSDICIDPSVVRIVLVGFSRGAAILIAVANSLPFPVHFLGLYDAVDMEATMDTARISNAMTTYHARRNKVVFSRHSWGNTGTVSNGVYVEKSFYASHGAIGGEADNIPKDYGFISTSDDSCYVSGTRTHVWPGIEVNHRDVKYNKLIHDLCRNEAKAADNFIRQGAVESGLILN